MKNNIAKQHRQAEFRGIAKCIVRDDREKRKYGHSVDTAGAIARALEKAYRRGRKEEREGEPVYDDTILGAPVDWKLIPFRPRGAFWSICLSLTKEFENKKTTLGGLELMQDTHTGDLRWVLIKEWSSPDVFDYQHSWGLKTIRPLVNLGLLIATGGNVLNISALGIRTWEKAQADAHGDLWP